MTPLNSTNPNSEVLYCLSANTLNDATRALFHEYLSKVILLGGPSCINEAISLRVPRWSIKFHLDEPKLHAIADKIGDDQASGLITDEMQFQLTKERGMLAELPVRMRQGEQEREER